jgi:predicted enzyme related to lactoylglutathione lyase
MSHRSRIGVIVIDCQTDDLKEPLRFWEEVIGLKGTIGPDEKYAYFEGQGFPRILLQKVDHAPRVHLDIEADDREAEIARLEALGATRGDDVKKWTVMTAPTGHRFCVVNPQGDDFGDTAREWNA